MSMGGGDLGVGHQAVIFDPQRRDHPLDRTVLFQIVVHPEPVVQPLIPVHMVDPPPVALDQKAFGRPHGIMVQAHPVIAIGLQGRPPAIAKHGARQGHARPVEPMHLVPQIGDQPFRPMHAQLLVDIDIAKQRLEAPGLMRLADNLGRAAVELLQQERILIVMHLGIAEQPPRQADHIGMAHRLVKRAQSAIADLDVDELIHIHADAPAAVLHDRFALGGLQGGMLWLELAAGHEGVDAMLHKPLFLQQVQHRIGAIRAIIGVDQEILHPDRAMVSQPFQNEGAFVLHRGDNRRAPRIRGSLWRGFQL